MARVFLLFGSRAARWSEVIPTDGTLADGAAFRMIRMAINVPFLTNPRW